MFTSWKLVCEQLIGHNETSVVNDPPAAAPGRLWVRIADADTYDGAHNAALADKRRGAIYVTQESPCPSTPAK